MSTPKPKSKPRRLANFAQVARRHGVSPRTMRNYLSKGYFPAYKVPGQRGVLLDIDEVDAAMRRLPARKAIAGVGSYGPHAEIVNIPAQPIVVER